MSTSVFRHRACWVFLLSLWLLPAYAQQPLGHDDYDRWQDIEAKALSPNGEWSVYEVAPPKGDGALHVAHAEDDEQRFEILRGTDARFTDDSRFVVYQIHPPHDSIRQARLDEVPDEKRPKPSLGFLDVDSGAQTTVERVQSYKLPDDGAGWLAYHRVPEPDTTDADSLDSDGAPLVLRNLDTGTEQTFDVVTTYAFSEEGTRLVYVTDAPGGEPSGLYTVALDDVASDPLALHTGAAYPQMAVDDEGEQVAFLAGADSLDVPHHAQRLFAWTDGDAEPRLVSDSTDSAFPDNWIVSDQGPLSFSDDGSRLFFGTAPRPEPPAPDTLLDEEEVGVDIWNWKDPYLQPMQKERADERRSRTYRAMADLEEGRLLQLGTEDIPDVDVGSKGDADVALAVTNRPYRQEISWDWPPAYDAYTIDLATGERTLIVEQIKDRPRLSPGAQYVVWWNNAQRQWIAETVDGTTRISLSGDIPTAVHDEEHDYPFPPYPYGMAGWTEDDERILIYDRYDVWAVDPTYDDGPQNLTDGVGRRDSLRFRYVDLSPDEDAIPSDEPLLLSAFNRHTKAEGFYRDRVDSGNAPEQLLMDDRAFSTPEQAEDADQLLLSRESFREFPDLYVTGPDMETLIRISDVNPHQEEYRWGTAERVQWTSLDGKPLQGILYTPDGFDPEQEYPLMVYFYERNSDNLHRYWTPRAHRSIINFSFYVSRGYVIFIPDIPYKVGYPGESAMNAVMPGVTKLLDTGFIDPDRVGVQGHSWGGYQIAYMVTETNLFAAAEAGAPVSNMTSAYGGIRWGSGMSRMFQYEDTQSRIGGTLWETPLRYIDNSPIFQADKIQTPLLMMHNDQDGAVPWEQGIELFVALRRLGKPAWLISYNDEPHWPTTLANKRDWAKRMQQFFDHYLKDAPAPVWLEDGVPAVDKGRTLGYEPVSGE